jgi:hypothetical protein
VVTLSTTSTPGWVELVVLANCSVSRYTFSVSSLRSLFTWNTVMGEPPSGVAVMFRLVWP